MIVIIDTSRIRKGGLAELQSGMSELAAFVEANEPRAVAYGVYIDEGAATVSVLQVHPDSRSAESHLELAAPVFAKFADLLEMDRIDVYGEPGDVLLERLRAKGRMLGGALVEVHDLYAGFERIETREAALCPY